MEQLLEWLLAGDVTIQYQVYRDLLEKERKDLYHRTNQEGYAKQLFDHQDEDGHWGGGYYRKKWISTHYTLMLFRRLNVKNDKRIMRAINLVLNSNYTDESGQSTCWIEDVCMNGMMLYAFTYYQVDELRLEGLIDHILE